MYYNTPHWKSFLLEVVSWLRVHFAAIAAANHNIEVSS